MDFPEAVYSHDETAEPRFIVIYIHWSLMNITKPASDLACQPLCTSSLYYRSLFLTQAGRSDSYSTRDTAVPSRMAVRYPSATFKLLSVIPGGVHERLLDPLRLSNC